MRAWRRSAVPYCSCRSVGAVPYSAIRPSSYE
jgi:hypothetical protein